MEHFGDFGIAGIAIGVLFLIIKQLIDKRGSGDYLEALVSIDRRLDKLDGDLAQLKKDFYLSPRYGGDGDEDDRRPC